MYRELNAKSLMLSSYQIGLSAPDNTKSIKQIHNISETLKIAKFVHNYFSKIISREIIYFFFS